MSTFQALLDHERRKLAMLRERVAEQERRIKTLEDMQDDPLDALLEQKLSQAEERAAIPAPAPATQVVQTSEQAAQPPASPSPLPIPDLPFRAWQRTPRRVPDTWVKLLEFIGLDGKTYDQVKAYINNNKLSISHGAARTQLMNYRKEFGFVENPRKGFYVATQKALDFIKMQKEEAPADDDGGPSKPQPTPLTRAEA